MADLVTVAANVVRQGNAVVRQADAGVALTAGQSVYLDPVSGTLKLAHAVTSVTTATAVGIALHAAAVGQPCDYQVAGDINLGVALTAGEPYFQSGANAGGIAPKADLVATWITNLVGIALSTTLLSLKFAMPSTPVAHG